MALFLRENSGKAHRMNALPSPFQQDMGHWYSSTSLQEPILQGSGLPRSEGHTRMRWAVQASESCPAAINNPREEMQARMVP